MNTMYFSMFSFRSLRHDGITGLSCRHWAQAVGDSGCKCKLESRLDAVAVQLSGLVPVLLPKQYLFVVSEVMDLLRRGGSGRI